MPTVLRLHTPDSPGIITFTHSEALWGVPALSKRARSFLESEHQDGNWIFGVHVQGDCSFLDSWPLQDWQTFVMWPNVDDHFLRLVPAERRIGLNCVNFMPHNLVQQSDSNGKTDVIVVSRAAHIKGISNSVEIVRELLRLRPVTTFTFVVPDPRQWSGRRKSPKGFDQSFFTMARQLFLSRELTQITFISSSQESFGLFPLGDGAMANLISDSKILLLNSVSEGTPRVIAEALLVGRPPAIPDKLRTGIDSELDSSNTIRLPPDNNEAAQLLASVLDGESKIQIDLEKVKNYFSEESNLPTLKNRLTALAGTADENTWLLEDLHLRLACHGQKLNYQIMNSDQEFFSWMAKAESASTQDADLDEDYFFPEGQIQDKARVRVRTLRTYQRIKRKIGH